VDAELVRFTLSAFVTLFVVVDPLGVVPIFAALSARVPVERRAPVVTRAVAIAFAVAAGFLIAGHATLAYLGVGVHAFTVSGGILLFVTALPMLFGQRPGLQSLEPADLERLERELAVFPLAVPLLSGPGTLTTILLLSTRAEGRTAELSILTASVVAVFALTWVVLRLGAQVMTRLGADGVHVVTRVMGIVLAALAVQYVLDGLRGWYRMIVT
jgi:multiple antibiotic resistance protein